MPLYEFSCSRCSHKFELLRSFGSADDAATCPCCGAGEARRLISTFASFSKSAGGATQSIGGSSCSSCSSSSCATCH
ncbi:MAG: zinc ribbon domain-containing protein [Chloroflexi bacterium]|nr:zinc ribbon domain-containing protein [Chloroflexota bacterium]